MYAHTYIYIYTHTFTCIKYYDPRKTASWEKAKARGISGKIVFKSESGVVVTAKNGVLHKRVCRTVEVLHIMRVLKITTRMKNAWGPIKGELESRKEKGGE